MPLNRILPRLRRKSVNHRYDPPEAESTYRCCTRQEEARETTKSVCMRCCNLLEAVETGDYSDFEIDPFHETEADLNESVEFECPICSFIKDDFPLPPDSVSVSTIRGCIDLEFKAISRKCYPTEPSQYRVKKLVLCRVEDDELLINQCQGAWSAPNSGSEASLDFAATLLSRCIKSHKHCVDTRQPSSHPTRLLDVEKDLIRLIDTRQNPVSGPYATLSHTWGNADIKFLTTQTLPEFISGMNFHSVPRTFQDAITVARKLHIRYLWIDCYCIIQAGELESTDKMEEMSKMWEVYSNSIINIGAGAAVSPLAGFFRPIPSHKSRHPAMKVSFGSEVRRRTSSTYLITCQSTLWQDASFSFDKDRNSILRRAWCMQERFLCPRMIHFSETGMFWECTTMDQGSARLPTQSFPVQKSIGYLPFSIIKNDSSKHEILEFWNKIISHYNGMNLSRPDNDKFLACGALAKIVAGLLDDEYVAGFFLSDLIPSLSWHGHTGRRSKRWRAPSWSWASWDGQIRFDGRRYDSITQYTHVVSYDCQLSDPSNPYGALRSAVITLIGRVVKVDRVESPYRRWDQCTIYLSRGRLNVQFDSRIPPDGHLVVLLTHKCHAPSEYPEGSPHGLILAPPRGQLRGRADIYRRVGAVTHQYNGIPIWEDLFPESSERVISIV